MTPAQEVRRLRFGLERILSRTSDLDVAASIAVGWELWRLINCGMQGIEPIKQLVRDVVSPSGRPGVVKLEGAGRTSCSVSISDAQAKLREDADLQDLQRVLGEHFGDLFQTQTQVQPRAKFGDRLKNLSPQQRDAVLRAIDLVPSTPRVSFD